MFMTKITMKLLEDFLSFRNFCRLANLKLFCAFDLCFLSACLPDFLFVCNRICHFFSHTTSIKNMSTNIKSTYFLVIYTAYTLYVCSDSVVWVFFGFYVMICVLITFTIHSIVKFRKSRFMIFVCRIACTLLWCQKICFALPLSGSFSCLSLFGSILYTSRISLI